MGYKWLAYEKTRRKFVGWVNHSYLRGDDNVDQFTEWDINFDLIPMLPQYINLVYGMYEKQATKKKRLNNKKQGKAPFVYPSKDDDLRPYRLHCENTPPNDLRSQLNVYSYPVHNQTNLDKHKNFENPNPVMGMYGILALDCNHSCHPEMHPYEWLWWLNLTDDYPSWNIGLIRDVSNRFKHWSSSPRTGMIQVPFTFSLDAKEMVLEIKHQVFSNFNTEGFSGLKLPENVFNFTNNKEQVFTFNSNKLKDKMLKVVSNQIIPYSSLVYYITDVVLDEENNILTGNFNLALSVDNAYTAQVIFKSLK
ncbi:MAG: hypothetical protein LRY27_04335 [Chitinophagales bacterium]|nr:hypothetical protein [Chitinophagales bacterium]